MARPKTPTNIHVLKGTVKTHPERMRERENEPKDDRPLGDAPADFSESEQKAWQDLVGNAIPGVLMQADRVSVEVAAILLASVRTRQATAAEYGQLIRLLGQFGMTPSERSKINLGGKVKSKNPFAEE